MPQPVPAALSVALCTYNGERYLREQLDSIAAQSVLPGELLIGDDGSTDATPAIIRNFASTAPFPVRLTVNGTRLGSAHNFFQSICGCQSDWIVLSDQDDIWLPDRIAIFQAAAQANPDIRVFLSDGHLVDAAKQPLNQTLFSAYRLTRREIDWINGGRPERALARHVFATGAGMMVRHSLAQDAPEPADGFLHDEWLAWLACPHLSVIEQPTFLYRQHGRQQTGIDGSLAAQARRFHQPKANLTVTIEQAVGRFQSLLAVLERQNRPDAKPARTLLKRKIAFLQARSTLPRSRPARLFAVLFRLRTADYHELGDGLRTMLKDIAWGNRL